MLARQCCRGSAAPPCFGQGVSSGRVLAAVDRGIKEGESPLDALYREIYEETGIGSEDVDAHEVASGIVVHISDGLEVSKTLYHARVAATDIKIAPDEHDGYCWSSVADVPGFLHWESNRATWDRVLPQIAQGC